MDNNASLISLHKIVDLGHLRRDSITSQELDQTAQGRIEHFDWCQIDDKIISVCSLRKNKMSGGTHSPTKEMSPTDSKNSSEEAEDIE